MAITYTVGETTERTNTFECAAWYENVEIAPQTAIGKTEGHSYFTDSRVGDDGKRDVRWVSFKFTGFVTSDYFQSLFAGNKIGKSYDRAKNIGKSAHTNSQPYGYVIADSLIHDPNTPYALTDEGDQYEAKCVFYESKNTWSDVKAGDIIHTHSLLKQVK
jgi:hypothetical protein|tara:strand:- start:272 stop:751 length:480 start_codon:yes stop_codon:yes gene_type:complete